MGDGAGCPALDGTMLADESDALVVTSGARPNVCITDEPGGDLTGAAKGPSLVEMAESMDVVSSDFEGGRRQASSTRGPANDATSAYIRGEKEKKI